MTQVLDALEITFSVGLVLSFISLVYFASLWVVKSFEEAAGGEKNDMSGRVPTLLLVSFAVSLFGLLVLPLQ